MVPALLQSRRCVSCNETHDLVRRLDHLQQTNPVLNLPIHGEAVIWVSSLAEKPPPESNGFSI
jgi:hypothetical protein